MENGSRNDDTVNADSGAGNNAQRVTTMPAGSSAGDSAPEIDDSLYNRQRYVLGEDAMLKLRKGKVAMFGLSGVGVETAKNLILGGCGHVSIWDPSEITRFDLSQSYCFNESEVGQPRLAVAIPKLQELNPGCKVDELRTTEFDDAFMEHLRTNYDCVVVNGLEVGIERRMFINDYLRGELTSTSIVSSAQSQSASTGVTGGAGRLPAISRQQQSNLQQKTTGGKQILQQKPFISADVFGVLGHVFVDLGNEFIVTDPGNLDKREIFFSSISEAVPSTVTTVDRCHLSKGDILTLHGVPAASASAASGAAAKWNDTKRFTIVAMRDIPGHPSEPNKFITQLDLNNIEPFPPGIAATAYFRQAPKPLKVRYRPLRAQLTAPIIRQTEFVNPHAHVEDHIAWVALMTYNKRYNRWPDPWDREDCARLATLAREQSLAFGIEQHIDRMFMKLTACTCKAQLAPLASFIGGFAAQEAMKAITGKFIPLQQFLYVDFRDLVPKNAAVPSFRPKGDRYDGTRLIMGDGALKRIFQLQTFMVGAGAIGCELLKNLALIGFGTGGAVEGDGGASNSNSSNSCITVTDDDHIEKSNLNRQFLFRPQHINKPKSTTAAEQVQKYINPKCNIKPYQKRVQAASQNDEEDAVFTDDFLSRQAAVLFALDNRNTRMYLAQRCCASNVAHFDSGTLGEYGHTFSVLPFVSEKYDNVRDPVDADESGASSIPYCTMKQFPFKFEHCIEWARDKFHTLFSEKPMIAQRSLEQLSHPDSSKKTAPLDKNATSGATVEALLNAVKSAGSNPFEGSVVLRQLLARNVTTLDDCIRSARAKYYKYFELKAKRLLRAFPPDHINDDGTPFWLAPKRAPEPATFDENNPIHRLFIVSYARLLAQIYNNNSSTNAGNSNLGKSVISWETCRRALADYNPVADVVDAGDNDGDAEAKDLMKKNKKAKREPNNGTATSAELEGSDDEQVVVGSSATTGSSNSNDNQALLFILESGLQNGRWQRDTVLHFNAIQFEKDDDTNGHMDFVHATANARAQMYRIEQADYLHVKRVAGRITPAIATTTACVAGLACLELLRFVHEQNRINESLLKNSEEANSILRRFRNAQLNLGDASLLLFEPNAAPKRKIFPGLEVSTWDTWRVVEPSDGSPFTIDYISKQLKERYNIDLMSMIQGTRIVWMRDFEQFDTPKIRQTDVTRMIQFNDKGYADISIDCERPEEADATPQALLAELPTLRLEKASAAAAAAAALEAKQRASTLSHMMVQPAGGALLSPRPVASSASSAASTGGGGASTTASTISSVA